MDNSNTGLRLILGILVVVLIIGIVALLFIVFNSTNTGGAGGQTPGAPGIIQTPIDVFPTGSPTKDTSKIIISEIRNGTNNSIASVSLMIPPTLIGLTAEINGQPVIINPIDNTTIRLDMPNDLSGERLEIQFKAGAETRSNCILNRTDIQRVEGDCIW